MMNFNKHAKSTLLALAVMTTGVSSLECNSVTAVASKVNKKVALSVFVAVLVAMKIRLDTKPSSDSRYADLGQDFKDLLESSKSCKHLLYMFDKYLVGSAVKIEDTSTETQREDGSIFTIKGKKLMQKPFGAMGLFDAYVLSQMKKLNEYVAIIAAFYLLVNNPDVIFGAALDKAKASK
ncbi:MAG TPA: hypothetical protein VLB80_02500 [Candidatus Babeliales bacterium]|nr:hypothetical protein [Candidatus Babeliales bacterium]